MRGLDLDRWLREELKRALNPPSAWTLLQPPAAAVVALLSYANEPSLLLIKRREREGDPWSGHVALPGGFVSPSDPSPLDAALRELREEVGVRLSREDVVGSLPLYTSSVRPEVKVAPYVAYVSPPPEPIPGPEVEEAKWLSLKALKAGRAVVKLGDREEEVDVLLAGGWTVWGLTYRIVSELLHRLRPLLTQLEEG